ncbi:MAG: tetratricopeptide repeat protein [Gemmatimonadetes bacterium]|nr:tetratricopeptide repeat protein [Gemmatimonadota bacterium]MYB69082.1 tetratricopeptide repeat protein [Gemmatimonadota bacterium]
MFTNNRYIVALFLLALILRLAYLVEIRDTLYFHTLILDAEEYYYLAQALLKGDWWLTTHRTYVHGPLYPALLALLKLGGAGLVATRLFQAVLGALSCVLLYVIARRFFPAPTPLLTGLIAVGYWPFILYNGQLLATTLTIFIELLLVIQLVRCTDRPSYWSAAGAGALLGLLIETRSNTLLLVPVALWWLYHRTRSRLLVPFCVGLCAVLAPFLIHNSLVQGTPLPFQGAWSFYMGNNPAADGTPYARQGIDWQRLEILPYQADTAASLADRGRFYLSEGLDFIVDQPLAYLHLLYRKFRLFWHAFEIPVSVDIHFYEAHSRLSYLNLFGFGLVAPLALVGLVWNWNRWHQYGLLYGFGLSYLVSGLLFTVCARYRLPAVPFLMLFAAEALRQGALSLKGHQWRRSAALALILGAALALGHTGVDPAQVDHLRSAWLRGQVHMRNQAYDRAERAYLQALQAGPDADVYSSLGAVYEAERRPREAETAYRRALALASDHTRARLNLGNLLRGEQRFDEAKALFLKALANDPRPVIQYEGHYYLGYLYLDRRDYLRAYGSFTTAVEAEQRAEGFYALANACHQLGRQDEQIRYLWQTVDIDPEFAAAHRNLGALYLQRGEHSLAEEALHRALQLEPDVAIAHYNLGVLYMRTGRRDLAQAAFEAAERLRRAGTSP